MKKKIVSIVLAMIISIGVSIPVSAEQPETSYVHTYVAGQPTPRYTYTSIVLSIISLDGQMATCSAGIDV